MTVPAAGALEVRDTCSAKRLGKGLTEPTNAWAKGGITFVQKGWVNGVLHQRIASLLDAAADVHRSLEALEFTYEPPA
jgi:hypothetical protein